MSRPLGQAAPAGGAEEGGRQEPVRPPGLGVIGFGGFALQEDLKKMGVGSALHLIILLFVLTELALWRE